MVRLKILLCSVALLGALWAYAEDSPTLRVVALFKNGAMVELNGKQKLYRAGQQLTPQIKLIKADTLAATFDINGKNQVLKISDQALFTNLNADREPEQDKLQANSARILKNNQGMFITPGFINGTQVTFMVDTGASAVALNESTASQLGLNYKLDGRQTAVSTAAGIVPAWTITLGRVKVGEIELRNVDALVVKGAGPDEVLLGMSFLSRVKLERNGQFMQLTQKY